MNELAPSAPISLQSKDKGKGKQKVVEKPKKKARRPKKQKVYNTRSGGECSRPIPEEELDDCSDDSNDANYDAIVDIDYELNPEDDEDVFDAHVETGGVHEFDEMGYEGNISDDLDEGANSDGFVSAHESDDVGVDDGPFKVKGKKRFSKWIEFDEKNDMKNPRFCLGMIFPNNKVFKHAVRKHGVMTKKELRFPRNTKHMISVKCFTSVGCPYYMYASSPNMDNPTLQIKKYKPKHTCCSIGKRVYHCNAPFLAEEYKNQFLADGKWSREGIQNAVAEDFEMKIGFQLAHRAKAKALKLAQGTIEDQYNNLESYAHELKKRNPGSSVWIKTELDKDVAKFQRIYICLSALKEGWKVGCRPIIGLDGCHLKGVHKGQLLSAIGIDGNNGMYPIAWAIVEAETFDTWTWFLTFLKEDLDIHHSRHYAFMSDKQKGLEASVKNLFPEAEHRFCVRHMHNNFKGDGHIGLELKQRLWAIARATTMVKYKQAMLDMRETSILAWKWCLERTAKHWSRSHFDVFFQCDILLNNHSESFNHSILEARKKPIIPCLEDIRVAAMVRLANRRNSAARWKCKVGPRIEKILKKNASWASQYRPLESSNFRFELEGRGVACESGVIAQHSVKLDTMSCSCRRWDLCGLPCGHAIAAIYSKGWSPDDFVSEWYTLKRYMQAYEVMIHPIAGFAEWEKIERKIAPPLYRRQPGRPKTKRNLEPGEVPPPVGIERLSKSYYSKGTCGMCRKPGHNARTCARRNPVTSTANSQQPQQAPNDPPQQQAANEPPSDVNVNLNLNVNVNVSMHDESGAANDIQIPSEHINMVQPTQESTTTPIAPTSSQKRYKRPAMRVNSPKVDQRKSARHAASGASNSTTIPPPKNQPRKRLWKP